MVPLISRILLIQILTHLMSVQCAADYSWTERLLKPTIKNLNKKVVVFFGSSELTGSIGVVTINVARLGYISKSVDEFKKRLYDLMVLAKNSLEIKKKLSIQCYHLVFFHIQNVILTLDLRIIFLLLAL